MNAATAIFLAGLALAGIAIVWLARLLRTPVTPGAGRGAAADGPQAEAPGSDAASGDTGDADARGGAGAGRRRAAATETTERLWRQVFEAPPPAAGAPAALPAAHQAIRAAVLQTLEVESLGERYFPRRPTLMPQLLHAVNDPEAGPARLAAIVAQDPVLTGDVVRLANSAFYRVTPHPVETIQRAIVVCGSDGLQSLIATALMQPVFRGTHGPFGRFPTVLWERTSQAAVAAETYAQLVRRGERLLAQLASLLGALGPLVIYRATIEAYARAPALKPNAELFLELLRTASAETSRRIARQWSLPVRVVAALGVQAGDVAEPETLPLAEAIEWGELVGNLAALERERLLDPEEAARVAADAGLPDPIYAEIRKRLSNTRR